MLTVMARDFSASILFLIALCAASFGVSSAHAQEQASVKIQPSIIEQKVDPGEMFSSKLRLTNMSGQEHVFLIAKEDISGITGDGHPVFVGNQEKTGYEVSSWISVKEDSVSLGAGETKEIPFDVTIPKQATPGGHFGALFFKLKTTHPKETGTGVGYEVGTIISLRVAGNIVEAATIKEFFTDKLLYDKPNVTFTATIKNSGNTLVRPRGPLEISDFFGKKVATLTVNDAAAAVLPGGERSFETIWREEGFAFGHYTVVMSLTYGDEGKDTVSQTLSFWVLPMRLIAYGAIGLLLIILAIIISVKLFLKNKLRGMRSPMHEIFGRNSAYHQKARPFSRLAVIALALLLGTLLFAVILFVLFA